LGGIFFDRDADAPFRLGRSEVGGSRERHWNRLARRFRMESTPPGISPGLCLSRATTGWDLKAGCRSTIENRYGGLRLAGTPVLTGSQSPGHAPGLSFFELQLSWPATAGHPGRDERIIDSEAESHLPSPALRQLGGPQSRAM